MQMSLQPAHCCQQGNDSLNTINKLGYKFLVISNGKQVICYVLKTHKYAHHTVLCMHFNILGQILCHRAVKLVVRIIKILLLTPVFCLYRQ